MNAQGVFIATARRSCSRLISPRFPMVTRQKRREFWNPKEDGESFFEVDGERERGNKCESLQKCEGAETGDWLNTGNCEHTTTQMLLNVLLENLMQWWKKEEVRNLDTGNSKGVKKPEGMPKKSLIEVFSQIVIRHLVFLHCKMKLPLF